MTAYGTLAKVIGTHGHQEEAVNAALLLDRFVHADLTGANPPSELQLQHLWSVADACARVPPQRLDALHARRAAAARATRPRPAAVVAVELTPCWRLVVGRGEHTAAEVSLTMSRLHGVPIIPASALKGLTAAHARDHTDPTTLARLFGTPRPTDTNHQTDDLGENTTDEKNPGENNSGDTDTDNGGTDLAAARQGSVTWSDAVPVTAPSLVVDVLTPHLKPYYDKINDNVFGTVFPAEYHNPVPVRFLALQKTTLRTLITGPDADDVHAAARWLEAAVDDRGVGGKTSAGYGYCRATIQDLT
ncbi:type III-B CRISPR module RAMP protein Cmr6 [Nocardia sp. NPDC003482]